MSKKDCPIYMKRKKMALFLLLMFGSLLSGSSVFAQEFNLDQYEIFKVPVELDYDTFNCGCDAQQLYAHLADVIGSAN